MSQIDVHSPPPNTAAAGQYLGYSLQQLRLCHHLLEVKADCQVSFEFIDDVAVHMPNGRFLLEQCKSVTSTNPIGDRAVDLWKTFANWADRCVSGEVDHEKTAFRLYVAPKGHGKIIYELSAAHTSDAATAALRKIKELLKEGVQAAAVDGHIKRFLAAGGAINLGIIHNFELVIDADPDMSVKRYFRSSASGQMLEDIAAAAIGMARDRVDNLIRKKRPPVVAASEFQTHIRAFVRRNNLANLLISKAAEPSEEKIAYQLNAAPVFVRQLQSVEASRDLITTAISDWLKAAADKIHWAAEGSVFSGSFQEFDAALIRRHRLVRDEVEDNFGSKTPQQRGRKVYRKCTETDIPLEGNEVPDHFVAGSFNYLADSCKVGWHPDYAKLFPPDAPE